MIIKKRINLNNNIYYVLIETEYIKNEDGMIELCLKNYKNNYYDGGDFSILIEQIEKDYTKENLKKYEKYGIGFIVDSLFIYDRIPFINGVEDLYISSKDTLPQSIAALTREELDNIIILPNETGKPMTESRKENKQNITTND